MSRAPTRLDGAGPRPAAPAAPDGVGDNHATRWYRRRGVLVSAGAAAVLTVAVITDLPSPTSRASDIASANAVVAEINADMAPCVFATKEVFTIYGDQVRHALSASDRAHVPALLQDDQTACSFTNQDIFDLSEVDVPGSAGGKQLGDIVNSVTLWATSDALGAIDAIQTLMTDPHDAGAVAALTKDIGMLASDRADADASIQAIDTLLGTRVVGLALPPVAPPPPAAASVRP